MLCVDGSEGSPAHGGIGQAAGEEAAPLPGRLLTGQLHTRRLQQGKQRDPCPLPPAPTPQSVATDCRWLWLTETETGEGGTEDKKGLLY